MRLTYFLEQCVNIYMRLRNTQHAVRDLVHKMTHGERLALCFGVYFII